MLHTIFNDKIIVEFMRRRQMNKYRKFNSYPVLLTSIRRFLVFAGGVPVTISGSRFFRAAGDGATGRFVFNID